MRWFNRLRRWMFGNHVWEYWNPYDRTCVVCGRHEVGHSWAGCDSRQWWWEVFADGDESKHESEARNV